jgi:alpha-D-ribose 1-methylphosphonate 5-triphosphate synthase subunit PhnH
MTAVDTYLPQSIFAETTARQTFQVLLGALSRPGHIFTLPGRLFTAQQSCAQIGLALLDLETSFYTPDSALRQSLQRSGARFLTVAHAAYLFFPDAEAFEPMMLRQTLDTIGRASVGSITDPDDGATVVVAGQLGAGLALRLHGPGIQGETELAVEGLPPAFWQLRSALITYPLGVDLFVVDGNQVVGLPRTTVVEMR